MKDSIDRDSKQALNESQIFYNLIWMKTSEAAEYLRLSESALRTLIHRNPRIPRYKLGNTLRFKREDLDRLLESSLIRHKEKL
jgi:excisionase family DNA binding protein